METKIVNRTTFCFPQETSPLYQELFERTSISIHLKKCVTFVFHHCTNVCIVSSPSSIVDRLSSAHSLQSDNRRVEPTTEPPLDPSLISQTRPSYSPDSSNSSDGHGNRHSPAASVDLSSSSDE